MQRQGMQVALVIDDAGWGGVGVGGSRPGLLQGSLQQYTESIVTIKARHGAAMSQLGLCANDSVVAA